MRFTSPNSSSSTDRRCRAFKPPHLLTEPFREYLSGQNAADLSQIRSCFATHWKIYVMGGVLRNLLLHCKRGLNVENRDLDLVIAGAGSSEELRAAVQDYWVKQNDFGGAKCQVRTGGVVFDIWRIEDHVNLSSSKKPPGIEELLAHNLLDIDAVVMDLPSGTLYDGGCLAAIEAGVIDLVGPAGISQQFPAAQAAHIVLVAHKTGFGLSNECARFVRERLNVPSIRDQVITIVGRKLQTDSHNSEQFLNSLLQEEPWPTMAIQ